MALVVSFLPAAASAQMASGPDVGYKREAGMVSSALPAPLREIGFDQNIGQRLPLDTPVRDEDGRVVPIGTYFGQRPVVLIFSYYSCPMLCAQVIGGLASALGVISLAPGTRPRDRRDQLRSARQAGDGTREESRLSSTATAGRRPRRPHTS